MSHLKTLLFVVGLLALVHAGVFFLERNSVDSLLRDNIAKAVTLLDEQNLELVAGSYDLYILPIRRRRSEGDLERMLRKWDHHDGPVYYWLSEKYDNLIYTMSARGLDDRQHLAHAYLEGYEPFITDNFMIPLYALAQRKRCLADPALVRVPTCAPAEKTEHQALSRRQRARDGEALVALALTQETTREPERNR